MQKQILKDKSEIFNNSAVKAQNTSSSSSASSKSSNDNLEALQLKADVSTTNTPINDLQELADNSNETAQLQKVSQLNPFKRKKKSKSEDQTFTQENPLFAADQDSGEVEEPRERRDAVSEGSLSQEMIEAINSVQEAPGKLVYKFNFAGSGEEKWKTHKSKYKKDGLDMGLNTEWAGNEWKKEKAFLGGNKTVFEYSGALFGSFVNNIVRLGGKKGGITDTGFNSSKMNLARAKEQFSAAMARPYGGDGEYSSFATYAVIDQGAASNSIELNVKGFSRGGATATSFAVWAKQEYPKVKVNLVAIDPVHGTGYWEGDKKNKGPNDMGGMDSDVDLSILDNSTYLLPATTEHSFKAFTPQKLTNYKRIIIMYGANAKHSMGLGNENDKKGEGGSQLYWQGEMVKGMKLSQLPEGLFIADSANKMRMDIVPVTSRSQWQGVVENIIGAKTKKDKKGTHQKTQRRDEVINLAYAQFIGGNVDPVVEAIASGQMPDADMPDHILTEINSL